MEDQSKQRPTYITEEERLNLNLVAQQVETQGLALELAKEREKAAKALVEQQQEKLTKIGTQLRQEFVKICGKYGVSDSPPLLGLDIPTGQLTDTDPKET